MWASTGEFNSWWTSRTQRVISAFPDYSKFLVVLIPTMFSGISWGSNNPMGWSLENSHDWGGITTTETPYYFFPVFTISASVWKTQFSGKRLSLKWPRPKKGSVGWPCLSSPEIPATEPLLAWKQNNPSTYVSNIKHTGLRGPEKGGGDKINGFNWEWNPVIK